jgi:outer membrane lipoprotein carrier protein
MLTAVVLSCISLVAVQAFADESCVETSIDGLTGKIQQRYSEISDLSAMFSQESLFLGLNQRKSAKGRLRFLKPGMMDWEYLEPEPQRFVADGQTLWFYQPELSQVTVSEFKKSFESDLPVSFLLGLGSLQESFDLIKTCRGLDKLTLHLKSKSADSSVAGFELSVNKNDYTPMGALITDVGGNETKISFSELKINTGVKPEIFKFEIPKGVDIIRTEQLATN